MPHPALRVCLAAAGQEEERPARLSASEHAKRERARPETDVFSVDDVKSVASFRLVQGKNFNNSDVKYVIWNNFYLFIFFVILPNVRVLLWS